MSFTWVRDLQANAAGPLETDICVLGSGPVGLACARGLLDRGHRVTLLELGAQSAAPQSEQSQGLVHDRCTYLGATEGRAFGLGGTSALWGGQLLPLRGADFEDRPQSGAPRWPIRAADLEMYTNTLQRWFGIKPTAFDTEALSVPHAMQRLKFRDYRPRHSKWLRFNQRNVAMHWDRYFAHAPKFETWVNARASTFRFGDTARGRRVREVLALSPAGHALTVRPRVVVIAAGALESARLVLELAEAAGELASGVTRFAGRMLQDHFSLRVARLQVNDMPALESLFAPHFEGHVMRSARLEVMPEAMSRGETRAYYAHLVSLAPPDSGFALVRDVLRSLQGGRRSELPALTAKLPQALPDIARLLWGRYRQRRLRFPRGAELYMHVDVEQAPRQENRVYLGALQAGGRRALHIDWDFDPEIPAMARAALHTLQEFWSQNSLQRCANLLPMDFGADEAGWAHNVHQIHHPAGTTRMSDDASQGVVDSDLRIHGTENVFVAGASVFPSMGAANPTLTAMALALRLASHIGEKFNA